MKKNFIDFLWPMLGPKDDAKQPEDGAKKSNNITEKDCKFIDQENIDQAIEIALYCTKNENERRTSVENKAAMLIGSFSLAVTILISLIKDFILHIDEYPIFLVSVVVVSICIVIVYLCRAALYAIDALARKGYKTLDISQFLYSGNPKYKEELFIILKNNLTENYICVNQKVDSMTMAQEFFKCAVRMVFILAILLFLFFVIA